MDDVYHVDMAMGPADRDWLAARDPNAHPQLLADIAARRWDLHALIAQHPRAYPQLRQWIAAVNPNSMRPQQLAPRRSGAWGWFIGIGSLTLVGAVALISALVSSSLVPSDPETRQSRSPLASRQAPLPSRQIPIPTHRAPLPSRQPLPTRPAPQPAPSAPSTDPVAKVIAAFKKDRDKFNTLAAKLNGNPVAPLVTNERRFRYLEGYLGQSGLSESNANKAATEARQHLKSLEKAIAAAKKRRGNSSGTSIEQYVDDSADGFVALSWDAITACNYKMKGDMEIGGCVKDNEAKIHLRRRDGTFGQWSQKMIVVHEMAHVYQVVDEERNWPKASEMDKLLKKGLFRGSHESMADCYSLEYLDEPDLKQGNAWVGYGYVCNASERKAIRKWAADVKVPMTD